MLYSPSPLPPPLCGGMPARPPHICRAMRPQPAEPFFSSAPSARRAPTLQMGTALALARPVHIYRAALFTTPLSF
eukprot:scaffold2056_cov129-Isochrysis_galbana.AAC.6